MLKYATGAQSAVAFGKKNGTVPVIPSVPPVGPEISCLLAGRR